MQGNGTSSRYVLLGVLAGLSFTLGTAMAGEADVLAVEATETGDGVWSFSVTVEHADDGWEHYADAWVIISPDGKILGERVLLHPHDNEQPFTRSLGNVPIPEDVIEVIVRAKDLVHGFGGKEMTVSLR